ncbi:siroheme synthase [Pseudooceanicola sediminis]|uniref:precorrin-2 dehydrogenase n=1 Tax=Pseudooceanicola sediminis TaxID=2211117 RepID=A0A399J121_9RHOB|nr:NAD(P)-dependent oxidoreductase [Pseudooceanicola sediminis]KAA2316119.1 siroheme synthase [Puniceibacterium sp. HSS470]RII38229.1 siroheme synthase [Pseudooceanicola sediminis]|tara:strand:- start:7690 stop:8685 length:996 start_codon:yes stop_codon:yes gene_type:complete
MRHFPIFLDMDRARVVVSGGGDAALAKLRLLLKTRARITVHTTSPLPEISGFARDGLLTLVEGAVTAADVSGATLVYGADEDAEIDEQTAQLAEQAGVLFNIVDNLEGSAFITPAMVDRAPLTIAIGTEGAAPMLARSIKRDLEERLPAAIADLVRAAQKFRPAAEALPWGRVRRTFWADWFDRAGPAAQNAGQDYEKALQSLLSRHQSAAAAPGHITLTFTGSDDPDLMTLKARKALHDADVVVHDAAISAPVLELARREARIIALARPTDVPPLHQLLALEADNGAHVVYVAASPLPRHLVTACRRTGLPLDLIPGIATPQVAQWKETA